MPVDPYSNEIRYSLAVVAHALSTARPRSVRIASNSVEMVKAVVRTLACDEYALVVETRELRDAVEAWFGGAVEVRGSDGRVADAAVFPFSLEDGFEPAGEKTVVAACYNTLSYKTLLGSRHLKGSVFGKRERLNRTHRTTVVAGLFSPVFVALIGVGKLIERLDSALYFRVEDMAMRRLIDIGPWWRLSYIVVLTGQRGD